MGTTITLEQKYFAFSNSSLHSCSVYQYVFIKNAFSFILLRALLVAVHQHVVVHLGVVVCLLVVGVHRPS